jgi:hypothetical protein
MSSAKQLQELIEDLYDYEPALVTLVRSFVVARYKRFDVSVSDLKQTVRFRQIGTRVPGGLCMSWSLMYTTEIVLSTSITHIGANAFSWLGSLRSIVIPDSVVHIGKAAFAHCRALTGVVMSKALKHIGECAFAFCEDLRFLSLPSTLTYLGPEAFAMSGLVSISFPDSLTEISEGTCMLCTQLQWAFFPKTLTTIHARAFTGCSKLGYIMLPPSLLRIHERAFEHCTRVVETTVWIPPSTVVHKTAFDSTQPTRTLISHQGRRVRESGKFCSLV